MPFTIDGEWIPNKVTASALNKPLKVRLVKRGKSLLTIILNLNLSHLELEELASKIKKKLGCGGAVKDDTIEIQGDKENEVKLFLKNEGYKI